MNIKLKISTLVALVSLTLGSLPAKAVSYDGSWHLQRFNSRGTSAAPLRPHRNHFCYLSLMSVEETDSGGEEVKCRVRRAGSDWWLEAILDKSSDADVECGAVCYNN